MLVALVLAATVLIPLPARAERKAVCLRECRTGIAACAAWHAPIKRRRAKHICTRELIPGCIRDGVVECERAPHYRGTYAFTGELAGTTCTSYPPGFSVDQQSFGFTVHDRFRDDLDVTIYGDDLIEDHGKGATLPWSVGDEDGNCWHGDPSGDFCAGGRLEVYGPPPRSAISPRPAATLFSVLSVYRPEPSTCTLSWTGELEYVPPLEAAE